MPAAELSGRGPRLAASGLRATLQPRRVLLGLVPLALAVIAVSFAYGFYLLYRTVVLGSDPSRPSPAAPASAVAEELQRARRQLEQGEVEQALVAYRRILAAGPSAEAQLGLAQGELLAGRDAVALGEFERVLAMEPLEPRALLATAGLYSRQSATWSRAVERYRSYLTVRPEDADARLRLARLHTWRRESAAALEQLERADVRSRMGTEDEHALATALVAVGRSRDALAVAQRLHRARPQDERVRRLLADTHAAQQQWSDALPLYRSLAARAPADAHLQFGLGLCLAALGDAKGALPPLAAASRALPDDREIGLAYARTLRASGDLGAAERSFSRVLPAYDADAAVLREFADLLLERREYSKAERRYRQAYELGLRDVRLRLALAGALRASGKPEAAVPLLESVYAEAPTDRLGLELAQLYRRVGRNQDALRLLEKLEKRSR